MVKVAADTRRTVASVVDPEIPVLTIEDLGILRSVEQVGDVVVVTITPTYSGCPAMRQIEDDIATALRREAIDDFEIRVTHNPAWTTDWISEEGHRKLAEFGIAPPTGLDEVLCPRCRADSPRLVAQFGSTACKALMVCSSCGEPFDYFKEF
ncbi:MAG TPA: 1,2-phenylacetyl-CoA epoxidase subunit PaaD [Acidimicrobiia bacterium]|nr:1,2-phenylacetyl-CoA epoxidase subunit PaaD [Acidimicrobiia bacterium]